MLDWVIERSVLDGSAGMAGDAGWQLDARKAGSPEVLGSLQVRFDTCRLAPRYWFHRGAVIHRAAEIDVSRLQQTLTLCSDLCGAAEIVAMKGLDEAASPLLRAACLWLASDRPSESMLFAEFPGVQGRQADADDSMAVKATDSAFFGAVLAHFLPRDIGTGSARVRLEDISGLLPRHPIYVGMLSPDVQAVVGQSPASAWRAALDHEGFRAGRAVRVLDAGAVHEGPVESSRAFVESACRLLVAARGAEFENSAGPVLVVSPDRRVARVLKGRCAAARLLVDEESLLREDLAWLAIGAEVWCVAL